MATKKNKDPGRPIDRPMAPVKSDTGWGRSLTGKELMALINKIYAKREEEKMSKLTDTLKAALDKKKGVTHVDGSDANPTVEKKSKVKTTPPTGKKPPTRSAGRGR
jgi:hypothetical protein